MEDIFLSFLLDSGIVEGGVRGNSGGHVEVGHHVEAGGCRHVEGVVGGVVVPLHQGEQEEPPQ